MRNMIGISYILEVSLLVSIHQAHASYNGASVTSCYTHAIYHMRFGILENALDCDGSNPNCRTAVLSVLCGNEDFPYCCDGLNRTAGEKFLYTMCDYIFEWNSVPNLGYLIQARVDPDHSRMFSNTSEIVGTWTPGLGNKILYCNSSMQAGESASPLPNSITHSSVYTEGDVGRPLSLNMTWRANSTLTSSNQQMEDSINITFFYTISRDVSTNFFPYTREDLSFELRARPTILPTDQTTDPTTITSVTVFPECPSAQAIETIMEGAIKSISSNYGVNTLGLLKSSPGSSCEQVLSIHPRGSGYLYWINSNNNTLQQRCY